MPSAGHPARVGHGKWTGHPCRRPAKYSRFSISALHRDQGLVEEHEPRLAAVLSNESPALQVAGTGDEVGVAESLTHRGGVPRRAVRAFVVTCGELLLDDRGQEQQVTLTPRGVA